MKKSQIGEIPVTSSTTTLWQRESVASRAASMANFLLAPRRLVWVRSEGSSSFGAFGVLGAFGGLDGLAALDALFRAIGHLLVNRGL